MCSRVHKPIYHFHRKQICLQRWCIEKIRDRIRLHENQMIHCIEYPNKMYIINKSSGISKITTINTYIFSLLCLSAFFYGKHGGDFFKLMAVSSSALYCEDFYLKNYNFFIMTLFHWMAGVYAFKFVFKFYFTNWSKFFWRKIISSGIAGDFVRNNKTLPGWYFL